MKIRLDNVTCKAFGTDRINGYTFTHYFKDQDSDLCIIVKEDGDKNIALFAKKSGNKDDPYNIMKGFVKKPEYVIQYLKKVAYMMDDKVYISTYRFTPQFLNENSVPVVKNVLWPCDYLEIS